MKEPRWDSIRGWGKDEINYFPLAQATEGPNLEYKEMLPGTREDGHALLSAVTSFANAAGGILIYGITAERDESDRPTAKAKEAVGVEAPNIDQTVLRLEAMIRDGVEPQVGRIEIRPVEGFPRGPVIAIRVPQSLAAPHMLVSRNGFYSRGNAGKVPMDIHQIRDAFVASETLLGRIRAFRDERIDSIVRGTTPVPLETGPKFILHAYPARAASTAPNYDPRQFRQFLEKLAPLEGGHGWNDRPNLDGFLTYSSGDKGPHAYVQCFRNGVIEAVASFFTGEQNGKQYIDGTSIETSVIEQLPRYLEVQRALEVPTPIWILTALTGVSDHIMFADLSPRLGRRFQPIDRSVCRLAEVLMEEYGQSISTLLRPAFDSMWQAAGWQGSINYDPQGVWKAG